MGLHRFVTAFAMVFTVSLLSTASIALACSPVMPQPSFDENLAKAPTAFIGTVETIENGAVYLRVEKSVKNAKEGDLVETQQSGNTCEIRFEPGQHWLYLGRDASSGSKMIDDEYGRAFTENADFVKEKFGYDHSKRASLISGKIFESCTSSDGPAFVIALDNHLHFSVHDSLRDIEQGVVSYAATPELWNKTGGAGIGLCDNDGYNCKYFYGTIWLSKVDSAEALGRVDIKTDEEHTSSYVFRVKRETNRAVCG